ncbi:unnamed protein product [Xylocopa violacea]|uniref:Reverse transcriptase domain-containing protein n=1 Tax=Xylocopa violacea TaxID=135666 RepID=A0ABP1MW20_XYLVO
MDLSGRTAASAAQHKRRCNAPPKQSDGYGCDICNSKFKTYAGLRQHQRRAHTEQYNNQDLALRDKRVISSRAQYTDQEIQQIACHEASIPNRTKLLLKDLLKILSDFSGRPAEGIKKLRLKDAYKNYLAKALDHSTNDDVHKADPPPSRASLSYENNLTPTANGQEASSSGDQHHLIASDKIRSLLKEIKDDTTQKMSRIIESIQSDDEINNVLTMLDEYISDIKKEYLRSAINQENKVNNKDNSNKKARSRTNNKNYNKTNKITKNRTDSKTNNKARCNNDNRTDKNTNSSSKSNYNKSTYIKRIGNRSKTKSSNYARLQKLYKRNPSQVAEHVLTGNPLNISESPPMEKFTRFYKELFSHKDLGWKPSGNATVCKYDLSHPISVLEIHEQLKKSKESASGVDEIDRMCLRGMPRQDLCALLNILWGLKTLPPILRLNRTTLLPKTGDLTDPKNWRPITISSKILRLLNKIVVTRLENGIQLCYAQRGFTRTDGVIANSTILQTLIKTCRSKSKPFTILSIDLAKAFDSVNITSIIDALTRKGVDQHTIEYIENSYKDVTTILECHGCRSEPISINRGVKQGDPMSGFLFNLVIDDLLRDLCAGEGVKIEGATVTAMAFADDIIIVAPNPKTMSTHIKTVEAFFGRHGLSINASKCSSFQNLIVPGTKRLVVDTRSHLRINGEPIPTLGVTSQMKYLGYPFRYSGAVTPSASNVQGMLKNLKSSPLKPWQKLNILQRYLIPRLHHRLQSMDINKKKLKYIDNCIVKFVKNILHLPITTPTPYIHAPLRCGGLGIPALTLHIAAIYLRQLERLKIRGDDQTQSILGAVAVDQLTTRLKRILKDVNLATKQSTQQFWSAQLHKSALGSGLQSMSPGISSWVYDPPHFWKGRDYIGAIQLRIGLLPTKGAPYMSNTDCRNASCTGTRESLYHVLQRCPVTHYIRVNRHDNINKLTKDAIDKKKFKIENAPRFTTNNNRYVPDLIALKQNSAYVIETTVAYETKPLSLSNAYKIKKQKYEDPELIKKIKDTYRVSEVKVMPLVVGARGSWLATNESIVNEFNLSRKFKNILCTTSLQWGVSIHRSFMNTVWRQSNPTRRKT